VKRGGHSTKIRVVAAFGIVRAERIGTGEFKRLFFVLAHIVPGGQIAVVD
jgi:hypothetical protein